MWSSLSKATLDPDGITTAYRRQPAVGHDLSVVSKIKGHRHPIITQIKGQEVTLLTVAYVAKAIGRSKWSVKHWQRLGLLPEPPFVLHPDVQEARRYLYPATFVQCLAEIASQDYVVRRLERQDWQRFQNEVWTAYETTVAPLLGTCVTREAVSAMAETNEGRRFLVYAIPSTALSA